MVSNGGNWCGLEENGGELWKLGGVPGNGGNGGEVLGMVRNGGEW